MTDKKEIKKYCSGMDCLTCDETEPCIYRIANKLQEQLKRKEKECDKYKQAFDEIEEIAKHNNFLVRDPFCGPGYRDLSGQILSIINKAKDGK